MVWLRAIALWLAIILAESLHGMLRARFLVPELGEIPARQVGVAAGSVIVLVIAWLGIRWLGARTTAARFAVGALWVVLTLAFELGLGMALGYSRSRMLADYQIAQGGMMTFGLVFMLFAPALAARARGLSPSRRRG